VKSSYSSIFDAGRTSVIDRTQVKVVVRYDNEWGYSAGLVELAGLLGARVRCGASRNDFPCLRKVTRRAASDIGSFPTAGCADPPMVLDHPHT
jgi:hypothetical protein